MLIDFLITVVDVDDMHSGTGFGPRHAGMRILTITKRVPRITDRTGSYP